MRKIDSWHRKSESTIRRMKWNEDWEKQAKKLEWVRAHTHDHWQRHILTSIRRQTLTWINRWRTAYIRALGIGNWVRNGPCNNVRTMIGKDGEPHHASHSLIHTTNTYLRGCRSSVCVCVYSQIPISGAPRIDGTHAICHWEFHRTKHIFEWQYLFGAFSFWLGGGGG